MQLASRKTLTCCKGSPGADAAHQGSRSHRACSTRWLDALPHGGPVTATGGGRCSPTGAQLPGILLPACVLTPRDEPLRAAGPQFWDWVPGYHECLFGKALNQSVLF